MMSDRVTEDRTSVARGIGRRTLGLRKAVPACAAALIGVLAWSQAGYPQSPPTPTARPALSVTVQDTLAVSERVRVPQNHTVVLETSVPIARAQIVESSIATVQSVSPTQFTITGVGYGMTQVLLWTEDGQQQVLEVHVERDLTLLNELLAKIDPQSDAQAVSVMGNILLTGTVSGAEAAERAMQVATLFASRGSGRAETTIQNHLRIAGEQQVLLHCTVAEVSRSASKRLGFNGFLAGDDFRDAFLVNQVGGINPMNLGAAGGVNVTTDIPFLTAADGIPLSPAVPLSLGFPRVQMQVFIQAMVENSLMRVLAEPDLVAVSGETASFLAGGEFPIPVPQSGSAVGAVTIEFREFGVRMSFTPVVLAHQRIRLEVAPEVSETDYSAAVQIQGFVVPGLTQRRVETTVEVGNGQTVAIAGLLSEEVRGLVNKVPALGDVPVLGALFRSVDYQRRNTELVILVTPEIIAPMDVHQVAEVPGRNYSPPNDFELYALGVLEGQENGKQDPIDPEHTRAPAKLTPLTSEPRQTSLHGPWGYSTSNDL